MQVSGWPLSSLHRPALHTREGLCQMADSISLASVRSCALPPFLPSNSTATPDNVLREALATIPSNIKAILPAAYFLKKQIRSHRAKQRIALFTASTAADIVVPENYKVTAARNNFLQADITKSRGKRVLIFSTDLVLDSINTFSIDSFQCNCLKCSQKLHNISNFISVNWTSRFATMRGTATARAKF